MNCIFSQELIKFIKEFIYHRCAYQIVATYYDGLSEEYNSRVTQSAGSFYSNHDVMTMFSEKGILTKESPVEVAKASDVVITMLPSSSHVSFRYICSSYHNICHQL